MESKNLSNELLAVLGSLSESQVRAIVENPQEFLKSMDKFQLDVAKRHEAADRIDHRSFFVAAFGD